MLQVPELKRAMGLDSLQNQAGEKVDFLINHGSRRDKLKILGNGVCAPVMASIMHSLVGGEPHNACSKPSALNSKVAVVTFSEASRPEGASGIEHGLKPLQNDSTVKKELEAMALHATAIEAEIPASKILASCRDHFLDVRV